jgi:site-specific DNA recombinase
MSSRQNPLQDPPDPAIITFAEELGRLLARREFTRIGQTAERGQRDAKGDHGESCNLPRYSSDLQNPRSIEDQDALCRRWCEREGHGVVATFSDAALSGATIQGRAGLKSLIAGAVERQFDVVVVESFDRVARSQSELPQAWEMLRFCSCELMAVDDGRASEISIGVRGLVGALYLTDLASKTRRGLAGKLAQGQRAGGLPYGYRPIVGRPGEHEIDRDQAAVVPRIFRDYARGYSCGALARSSRGIAPIAASAGLT